MNRLVFAVLVFLALCLCTSHAAITFEQDGQNHTVATPQLWYEGYWKHVGWVNATVKHWPTSDVTGHIILVRKAKYPYDGFLRKISPMRPAAVLFVQETVGFPGDGMYAVDGRERKSITIPVAETYASKKVNASLIPDGTYLEMHVDYNVYTDIKGSAYFPVMNSIVSIWEWCILILAGYHLYLFSRSHLTFSWLSIGPLCLVLEMIGLAIRFGTTIVDPFYSNRLLHVNAMGILISVHMPFLISSGILLTFYWAEMLTSSSLQVTPFISKYRKAAIVVVVTLFAMEIITDILRSAIKNPAIDPVVFSVIYYVIVSIALAVCYIVCVVTISRRVKNIGARKYTEIRKMNLRFALSSAGYISIVILEIGTYFAMHRKWAPQIVWYLLYIAVNFASMMQVLGLKPAPHQGSSAALRTTVKGNTVKGARANSGHSSSANLETVQDSTRDRSGKMPDLDDV